MINSFTTVLTANGFVETLVYKGKTYVKRYKKDESGWEGLDKDWSLEEDLPDHIVESLSDGDPLEIMDALEFY